MPLWSLSTRRKGTENAHSVQFPFEFSQFDSGRTVSFRFLFSSSPYLSTRVFRFVFFFHFLYCLRVFNCLIKSPQLMSNLIHCTNIKKSKRTKQNTEEVEKQKKETHTYNQNRKREKGKGIGTEVKVRREKSREKRKDTQHHKYQRAIQNGWHSIFLLFSSYTVWKSCVCVCACAFYVSLVTHRTHNFFMGH